MRYERKEVLLRAIGVGVEVAGRPVLRAIDVEIRNIVRHDIAQGQVVGVLGPSGAGKTTLFRVLAGLVAPTGGRVLVAKPATRGAATSGDLIDVRPGMVGVVQQRCPLFEHRTVLGNLLAARRDEARARDLIQRFGLADRASAWPCELSGGQRQRVAIMQQLLCGHTYLLMDEPFSGLDPIHRAKACELIVEVSHMDERNTIVLVTHDIRSAVEVCDTLWLLGRDAAGAGSRIVGTYDLIERGLAWHPELARTPAFAGLVRELEDRFASL